MRKVRFALIGAGQLARNQHLPNLMRSEYVELAAVCDRSEEVRGKARDVAGLFQGVAQSFKGFGHVGVAFPFLVAGFRVGPQPAFGRKDQTPVFVDESR